MPTQQDPRWRWDWVKSLGVIHLLIFFNFKIRVGVQLLSGFPGGSDDKESACHAEDPGSIPGSGRSPGEGNGNPLQYSCLQKPMDRGAWQATVHSVTESDTTDTFIFTFESHMPYGSIYLRHLG